MVSHDDVAFYLLSQEVSKHVKVVQSGQGADEVFAGYHWYATVAASEEDGFDAYRGGVLRRRPRRLRCAPSQDRYGLESDDQRRAFAAEHFGRPGADEPVDRALRLDTEVMLVDDPVKRVDNMTMAWGLEARVPFLDHELVELAAACPPELKLAQDGKGVLKDIGRDACCRPRSSTARRATSRSRRSTTSRARTWSSSATRSRRERRASAGCFAPRPWSALLDAPNDEITPLDGNRLWQLGLLELWLQRLPGG